MLGGSVGSEDSPQTSPRQGDNRLPALAKSIAAAHAAAQEHGAAALAYAIQAGKYLQEAKSTVQHGGWLGWQRDNCAFSVRTAQTYMQVAERYGDDANTQHAAHLTLREAIHAVAISRREERIRALPAPHGEHIADNEEWKRETRAELERLAERLEASTDLAEMLAIRNRCGELIGEAVEIRLSCERWAGELLPEKQADRENSAGGPT